MTPSQRRALLVAGGVAVVVVVIAAALVLTADGDGGDVAGGTSSSSVESSTPAGPDRTTVPLRPVTTPPPGEASTTAAPPPAEAPVAGAEGAVLARPDTPAVRARDDGESCAALGADGYSVRCGSVEDLGDTYVWLVERNDATGGLRASVLRETAAGRYTVVLTALDDGPAGPARFSSVDVVSADVAGDGTRVIVFGFRNLGSAAILDVDVVEAPGRVVVHRSLDKGRAAVEEGRLEDWAAEFGPNDASCCPSRYRHGVVSFVAGAWRLVVDERVAPGDVPDGDFT